MSSTVERYVYGVLICLFVSFQGVHAATFYVAPDGNNSNDGSSWELAKETLIEGVRLAASGDLVVVSNGTYSLPGNQQRIESGVTVRSVNGPSVTFINGELGIPAVILLGTLDGFTVRNGSGGAYRGGGININGGVAANCIITNCTTTLTGGGIYLSGGGTVSNCTIKACSAPGTGGGIMIQQGIVIDSTIIGNVSGAAGGGIYIGTSCEVLNCVIRDNEASGNGGGAYVSSSAKIYGCLVTGNQTSGDGGGVYANGGPTESCTIIGNRATGGTQCGGLHATVGGSTVRNCILYYNYNVDTYQSYSMAMYNSCYGVGAGSASSYSENITNAPDFVAIGSGYGTSHVFGDYMLRPESPCVDTGTNQTWMVGMLDLSGTPRIEDGIVNRGAYEKTGTGLDPQTITFAEIPTQDKDTVLTLAATASSGLTVSYSVSGPARLSGTRLSFTGVGEVSVTASQAGNETYDPAPDVIRTFEVYGSDPFRLQAFALTNSVVLRWPDPYMSGYSNRTVVVRYGTETYPATSVDGSATYTGTNQVYTHTGRTPGTTYYYSIFPSHDGVTFVVPE